MSFDLELHRSEWPRTGLALGGIGTGGFEIRPDGGFYHWTLYNNWPLFTGARYPYNEKQSFFFLLWSRTEHENPRLTLLQIEDGHDAAAIEQHEFQYIFPWIGGVDRIRFSTSVPFADLDFERDGLPLRIRLRAWSPFIPGNVADSALPLAFFDFEIESASERPMDLQLLAVIRNAVGFDQPRRYYAHRRIRDGEFSAVSIENGQLDPAAATTGAVCLASFHEASSAYVGWEHHHPYYERLLREFPLPEVDDTAGRNHRDPRTGELRADPRCFATIGRPARLDAWRSRLTHTFALAWHFPNLYARPSKDDPDYRTDDPGALGPLEGQAYTARFDSAEAVARYAQRERHRLFEETTAFQRCFFDSDLPGFVLDQVNSHLNTLRTSAWRTTTGLFGILEGLSHRKPFAGIGTMDVAMYGEIAVSLLFPELDRATVEMWRRRQRPNGIVPHSVPCNSGELPPNEVSGHRLDLPAQYVFLALRAALWSGDRAWLETLWPSAKAALAYVLRERDRNGDRLPDMEGVMCSYDNFPMYGVAPYVAGQWLAAVALALAVARRLGDDDFAREYGPYFESGRRVLTERAWNGRYFQLYSDRQPTDPAGADGCMSDQLVGDGLRHAVGLPPIAEPEKCRIALRSILEMNYRPEQGLRNCQWPGDAFLHDVGPNTWIDQANTCWTGVELLFAAQLLYEGFREDAFEIVRNVDERHRRWGIYFDHQEFGGHYFRALSALAIPNAFLGLSFDGETLRIAPARPLPVGRWCFLAPGAWGTFYKTAAGGRLELRGGSFAPPAIEIAIEGAFTIEGFAAGYRRAGGNRSSRFER